MLTRSSAAGTLALAVLASVLLPHPAFAQDTDLERVLARAGAGRPTLEAFLRELTDEAATPKKLAAARFLLRWMPTSDLATLAKSDLRSNLDLAFAARETLPWGRRVPWPLFLHYVLPHRFAQERADAWRTRLWPELRDLVADCPTMADAAIAVTNWCARRVKFKQTEWRDQNVTDTLAAGYGRCEEMMIVGLAAMRTVGIPARPCSTPWWVTQDNNHAWIEVWADGNWYYLGGSEATTALDQTWFRAPAQRAGMVVSVLYGKPSDGKTDGLAATGDRVYKTLRDASLINSTSVYARTGEFRIHVLDERGEPIAHCPLAVSVFNFGGLRALTRRRTAADGMATVELGLGEYFLSAGVGERRAFRILKTQPGELQDVQLPLQQGAQPPKEFWLRYPTPTEAARLARSLPKAGKVRPATFQPEQPQPAKPDLYEPGKWPELDALIQRGPMAAKAWRSLLSDARGRWRAMGEALLASSQTELPLTLAMLQRASHLDRLEMDAKTIVDHVRGAARFDPGKTSDERERFLDFVLNQRIDREHPQAWRTKLLARFEGPAREDPPTRARRIHAEIQANIVDEERGRFGPIQAPLTTLRAGRGSARARAILAVAALRALGTPARFDTQTPNGCYFHDGSSWQRLGFGTNTSAARKTQTDNGRVLLRLRRDGKPSLSSRPLDFSRFEKGAWNPIRGLHIVPDGQRLSCKLAAGSYLLTLGVRNANGDPWVRTRSFELRAGDELEFRLALDLPEDAGIFRFPLTRSGKPLPALAIPGSSRSLASLLGESPTLLLVLDLDQEPSVRALSQAEGAWSRLHPLGTRGLVLYDGAAPAALPSGFTAHALGEGPSRKAWRAAFPRLPAIALLHKGGKPLLELEGFDLKLQDLLEQAARQLRN